MHHHLEYFSKQLASESDEHGERFHQVAMPMETRYKGKRLDSLVAEICWWSQKTYDPDNEDEEEEYTMGVSSEDEDRSSSDTDSEQVGEPPRKKVKGANKRK
ncbi:PREDICTED: uncharacterized protein LOC108381298 isoform X2 [Rhagoletis zephyria]|uniref:uncharacterized protein LOC108381298 isoform X2 n=1 Tax=Rhagoletis zephyria TaxID=28612 RepID=UPI000811869F|nr:PREDICTED: uncharacterized protein LOC108381298 isoform X2 [Rhagoletis zephyria]